MLTPGAPGINSWTRLRKSPLSIDRVGRQGEEHLLTGPAQLQDSAGDCGMERATTRTED